MTTRKALQVKVHRVASEAEVEEFDRLGADYIGFHVDEDACYAIDPDPLWSDDRYIDRGRLRELLPLVRNARAFAQLPEVKLTADVVKELSQLGIDLVQVRSSMGLADDAAAACLEVGTQVMLGDLAIAPEDLPIVGDLVEPHGPPFHSADIQLFPSDRDAWKYLTEFSPRHGDEVITLDTVKAVAKRVPLFVSLNANRDNIADMAARLGQAGVMGLSFTLSRNKLGSYHTTDLLELRSIWSGMGGSS